MTSSKDNESQVDDEFDLAAHQLNATSFRSQRATFNAQGESDDPNDDYYGAFADTPGNTPGYTPGQVDDDQPDQVEIETIPAIFKNC